MFLLICEGVQLSQNGVFPMISTHKLPADIYNSADF